MSTVYADLSRAGIRATPSRVAVLAMFREHPLEHFSADQIYRRLSVGAEPISLASVYRSLAHLVEAGLVASGMLGESRVVYELNRGDPHYHLVCHRCGAIRDIHDATLAGACRSIASAHRFADVCASVVISGQCPDCQSAPRRRRA